MVNCLLKLASIAAAWCLLYPSVAEGHSFLVKPVARDTNYRSDTKNTVGCPNSRVGNVTSFEAGETIDVSNWRNNHIGGFIRWSLVARGEESHDNFDKNAFYYTCRESGADCVPKKNANRPITGETAPVPTPSAAATLSNSQTGCQQWTWFGVGHSGGNLGWAEPQFRSCADIKLTTKGSKASAPKCPTVVGGDRITKSQNKTSDQCFYFYTTDIVGELYRGSNDESVALPLYKYGVPKPVERCHGGASANSNSTGSSDDANDGDETGNDTDMTSTPVPSTKTPAGTKVPAASTTTPKPTDAMPAATTSPAPTSVSCRRKDD